MASMNRTIEEMEKWKNTYSRRYLNFSLGARGLGGTVMTAMPTMTGRKDAKMHGYIDT
jgi:hypothetical protein